MKRVLVVMSVLLTVLCACIAYAEGCGYTWTTTAGEGSSWRAFTHRCTRCVTGYERYSNGKHLEYTYHGCSETHNTADGSFHCIAGKRVDGAIFDCSGPLESRREPTCTNNGREQYRCSTCKSLYVIILPAGHSYTTTVTPPTCTEDGYTTYVCSACGDTYTGDAVASNGHSYGATVTPPTCTEDGYTTYVCSACGDTYTGDAVASNGHSYGATVTPPTCTEDGYTTYICSACGDTYTDDAVASSGHSYGATVTPPTCTEDGYTTYVCSACGDTYTDDAVVSSGHSYGATVTPPTCTEGGYTAYVCSVCGDNYIGEEVEASGHRYDEIVTPVSCVMDGYTTYICQNCNDTYQADWISAIGHRFGTWQYDKDGYHGVTCTRGCRYRSKVLCMPQIMTVDFELETVRSFEICPVCGKTVAMWDDACVIEDLGLLDDATVTAASDVYGAPIVRRGFVDADTEVISIAFVSGGSLCKYTGIVRIELPAEKLEGYSLFLNCSGMESEIPVTIEDEMAVFEVYFGDEEGEGWYAAFIRLVKAEK